MAAGGRRSAPAVAAAMRLGAHPAETALHVMKILGRSLVDCFCRYVGPMVQPEGPYWPTGDGSGHAATCLRHALAAIEKGALVEARTLTESLLAKDGRWDGPRLLLAALLSDRGQSARAREELSPIVNRQPHDGRLWFMAGQLAERCGEVEEAIRHYTTAVSLGGHSACEASERLAAIYLATDDLAAARDRLAWLVEARPEEFRVRLELASVQARLGDLAAAARTYEDAILMDPDDWEARKDYARTLEEQGRLSESLAELRLVLDEHPRFADLHVRAARLSAQLGDLRGASRHIDAALETNPRYLDAIVVKGMVLAEQNEWDAAMASFHRAIEVNEEYTMAYAGLALAQERAGLERESAETMELAREVAPGSEEIYARLSRVGFVAAMEKRKQCQQPIPASAASRFATGEPSAECSGGGTAGGESDGCNHDEAMRRQLELHRAAVEKHPEYADLRYYYGLLLASLGRTAEAAEQYEAAVRANPRYVEALVRLAVSYWRLNRPQEAFAALSSVSGQGADELSLHYRFGLVWSDRALWPLAVENVEAASGGEGGVGGGVTGEMQNLGLTGSDSRAYLSSLKLVDHRDRPVQAQTVK